MEFDFEDGVTVTGVDDGSNLVIVKYNTSGTAQWAKTVTGGPEVSEFVEMEILLVPLNVVISFPLWILWNLF